MSVPLVIDMNLSPEWVSELAAHGWSAVHWSTVGNPTAEDAVIMDWAKSSSRVVFTHDLDFGTMLALTHAVGPSVLQVRPQSTLPEDIGPMVIAALQNTTPNSPLALGCCRSKKVAHSIAAVVASDRRQNDAQWWASGWRRGDTRATRRKMKSPPRRSSGRRKPGPSCTWLRPQTTGHGPLTSFLLTTRPLL